MLTINLDRLITPQTIHVIPNEGMTNSGANASEREANALKNYMQLPRGNLYIKFNILFPVNLSAEKKTAIAALLRE